MAPTSVSVPRDSLLFPASPADALRVSLAYGLHTFPMGVFVLVSRSSESVVRSFKRRVSNSLQF